MAEARATKRPVLKRGDVPLGQLRRGRRLNTSCEPWTAAEELRLRELAGRVQVREVARRLTHEFHVPRTVSAVNVRAKLLGLSLWWDGYSQNQVAKWFGVTFIAVTRWRTDGLLPAQPWEVGRGRYGQWHITEQDLSRFIDTCAWAYDLAKMPPGPWRSRAEVAYRADPWLTVEQVCAVIGMVPETLRNHVRAGRVPYRRRVAGVGLPKIVIRASDLSGLKRELREHALTNLRAATALRVERRRARAA